VDLARVAKAGGKAEQADESLVVVSIGVANGIARVAFGATAAVAVSSDGDELAVGPSQNWSTGLSWW
jgi:hypothetical protein